MKDLLIVEDDRALGEGIRLALQAPELRLQLCHTLAEADELMAKYRISGVPICDHGKLIGIITNRDMKFETDMNQLIDNGQIATQYVDLLCRPTMDMRYNPNGSVLAIEGITSPDGRVFGKMGHSERSGEQLYKNVTGDKYQPIFEGGVNYFKL